MRPTRKCEFCGKTFVPRSGMQKYCSEECQAEAKRLRKKRQQDLINGIEPIMDLQHQEYLTFSKAAILMGCTRQYIYKLVANGKLKASRLSSRMAFVRKADIEKMFEGNPYKRVVPASKSKPSKKAKAEKPTQNLESTKGKEENEVLDYYSGEEVMSIYKVKKMSRLASISMPSRRTRWNRSITSTLRQEPRRYAAVALRLSSTSVMISSTRRR